MKKLLTIATSLFAACWLNAATYYVDPAAGGANDGTSWTDAWTDMESADGSASAGDTVLMRGEQDLSGSDFVAINTAEGSGGNRISWIGTNGSGVDDGTTFVIDGAASNNVCIRFDTDFHYIKNMECKNSQGQSGFFFLSTSNDHILENCYSHDNGVAGYDANGSVRLFYIGCSARNNTAEGWLDANNSAWAWCDGIGNGDHCVNVDNMGLFIGNVFHANTGDAVKLDANAVPVILTHNVFDGNDDAISDDNNAVTFLVSFFNRLTNNAKYGTRIENAGSGGIEGYNLYLGNDTSSILDNGQLYRYGGSQTTGTFGYQDLANDTFIIDLDSTSATLRRTSIGVGQVNDANLYYGTAGLPPADTACSGGGGSSIYNPIIIRHGF